MADSFFQKPLGIASLVGGAVLGPYIAYQKPSAFNENSSAATTANSMPDGYLTSLPNEFNSLFDSNHISIDSNSSLNTPFTSTPPYSPGTETSASGFGVADFREVLRFDITPGWVTDRFPRVTTVLADTQLDGVRVPFVSGSNTWDIAGALSYYFDKHQAVRRIQWTGTTGDPQRLVQLMTTFYGLTPEPILGGHLYTARWNSRVTSVLKIAPAPVIDQSDRHQRYRIFLELNQPSLEYGLTNEASSILHSASATNRW